MSIRDSVVAITGASSGIGRATALFLAQEGATIVLGARREDRLASVAHEISIAGGRVAYRTTDVTVRQDVRVTEVSPGFVATDFANSMTDPTIRDAIKLQAAQMAISPEAIPRGVLFALQQPADVDVGSIVIRPTAQG